MTRALLLILVAMATIAGALLLWEIRSVIILLVAAIVLGAAVRPVAERLSDIGVPRVLSILLMTLLIIVLVLGLIAVLGFALGEDLPLLLRDVQMRMVQIRTEWAEGEPWQVTVAQFIPSPVPLERLIASLDELLLPTTPATAETGTALALPATPEAAPQSGDATATVLTSPRDQAASSMLRLMLGATGSVAGFIGQFVILVFISLYWTLEHEWFERMWISLLPAQLRQAARKTWRAVESNVGAHVRSEALQSLLAGVLIYLGLRLLQVDTPLLLATIAALAWLIPLVGGIIALAIVVPVAVVSPLWVTVAVAILVVLVLAFMEFVLEPRLDRGRERMEIFGLVMAMIMLHYFGILGLLLASPIAVLIATVMKTWDPEEAAETIESRATLEASLSRRLAILRQMVGAKGETLPQRTQSLYQRLEEVVQSAEKESTLHLGDFGPQPPDSAHVERPA